MDSTSAGRSESEGCGLCPLAAGNFRCQGRNSEPGATALDQTAAGLLDVVIACRSVEADDVISLSLERPDGGELPRFEAGAHIDVHVAPGVMRQYSLCSDPANCASYELAVLLEPQSRGGSAAIHRTFDIGRTIRIGRPRNNFLMVPGADRSILVAGGIGITPLLSMMHVLHAERAEFSLHYAVRSRSRAAFLEQLVRSRFTSRVSVHCSDGGSGQRFSAGKILPHFERGSHLYTCGPRGFMDMVIADASRLGWPRDCIHTEHFGAAEPVGGEEFTVRAARSDVTVSVPSGTTIAKALADAGVAVDLSCQQGICGSCVVKVISGVPDHGDLYFDEREKASNDRVAICCSRALTDRLVLDV